MEKMIQTQTENNTEKVEKFTGGFSKVTESFKANKKTWAIIACAAVLIIGAIWLNVSLFADNTPTKDFDPTLSVGGTVTKAETPVDTPTEEESYFVMAKLNRTQVYDSAYEDLLAVATSTTSTAEAKNAAYESIAAMAKKKQVENSIETLIKAKGIKECIAVMSEETIDIIVMSDELLANEVAQIGEIVLNQSGITPDNVRIIKRDK